MGGFERNCNFGLGLEHEQPAFLHRVADLVQAVDWGFTLACGATLILNNMAGADERGLVVLGGVEEGDHAGLSDWHGVDGSGGVGGGVAWCWWEV